MSETSAKQVMFLNGEIELALTPNNCSGNACGFMGIRANFRPGTNTIASFSVRNGSPNTVNFSLTWADLFGTCNVTSNEVIFPGEIIEVFAPGQYNLGYCSIRANTQALTDQANGLMGAQCSFDGRTYNDGETTCINDTDHVCRNGRWTRLGTREYCSK